MKTCVLRAEKEHILTYYTMSDQQNNTSSSRKVLRDWESMINVELLFFFLLAMCPELLKLKLKTKITAIINQE